MNELIENLPNLVTGQVITKDEARKIIELYISKFTGDNFKLNE